MTAFGAKFQQNSVLIIYGNSAIPSENEVSIENSSDIIGELWVRKSKYELDPEGSINGSQDRYQSILLVFL